MTHTIALDLGNTHLTWGVFDADERLLDRGKLPVTGDFARPPAAWQHCARAGVASVNREGLERLRAAWCWPGVPSLEVLGQHVPIPVRTLVPHPEQVGADRLMNALAWRRRSPRPAVVVDFGTAVTLDLVSPRGEYRGGLILPGPEVISEAMHRRTSLLPEVEIGPTTEPYGRDTESAIRRGAFGLLCGGVQFHLDELRRHLETEMVVVATGGGAAVYAPWIPGIERVVPCLTLCGIFAALCESRS